MTNTIRRFIVEEQEANIDLTVCAGEPVEGVKGWHVVDELKNYNDHGNLICKLQVEGIVIQNESSTNRRRGTDLNFGKLYKCILEDAVSRACRTLQNAAKHEDVIVILLAVCRAETIRWSTGKNLCTDKQMGSRKLGKLTIERNEYRPKPNIKFQLRYLDNSSKKSKRTCSWRSNEIQKISVRA